MSRGWSRQRARLFAAAGDGAGQLVGRDFSKQRTRLPSWRSAWLPLLVGCVAAALLLASLRVSILRVRYQLAAALEEETSLLAEQRQATVTLRELRDPRRLQQLAAELELRRPERVIDVALPPSKP